MLYVNKTIKTNTINSYETNITMVIENLQSIYGSGQRGVLQHRTMTILF